MTTLETVKTEMAISLAEWGVNPANGPEHRAFYERAIKSALLYFQAKGDTDEKYCNDEENDFPTDAPSAIEHVLRSELEGGPSGGRYLTFDSLVWNTKVTRSNGTVGGNPPFFRHSTRGTYLKKKSFARFSREQLDPLGRFVNGRVTEAEYFYSSWFDANVVVGLAFEAIVACHAVHNEKCASCKKTGCLRWTGGQGPGSAWRDIVCTGCRSSYEIKSKQTREHINRNLETFGGVRGGSFFHYHHNKRSQNKKKNGAGVAKRFLVLISRTASWLPNRQPVWPVEIVEINHVVPRLQDRSFPRHDGEGRLSIRTEVRVNKATRVLWFQVPVTKCDYDEMARRIYDEHFSSEERERMEAKWKSGKIFEEVSKAAEKRKKCRKEKQKPSPKMIDKAQRRKDRFNVAKLKQELELITLEVDDWEDLDSD